MARMARLVVAGLPHHVVQRGVRSMAVFEDDADRQAYRVRSVNPTSGRSCSGTVVAAGRVVIWG